MSNHNLESSILQPRDPSITNSDDWPIFVIKNALVFDPLDPAAEPCNLLHAGAYRPLTVSGRLESPANELSHLLLNPSYHRSRSIEITNVKHFSYGQYEDGSVDIWAAGLAGWYTINPSRTYKHLYADMVQAVQLLYFTADTYKAAKRSADLDAADIFRKYCLDHPATCTTPDDAEKLFARHRYFLFASMLDGKEGLQWARLPLFKYLEVNFPDDTAVIRQRRAFAMKPPKAPSSKRGTASPAPSSASLKRKRKDRSGTPASLPAGRRKSRSASVATAAPSPTTLPNETLSGRSRSQRESARLSQQSAAVLTVQTKSESDADSDVSAEHHRSRKGKSSLRPKPSKYLHNRPLGRGMPDGNDADDDETDEPQGPVQSFPSSKRKMLDDSRNRRAKRRNSEMPLNHLSPGAAVIDSDADMDEAEDGPEDIDEDGDAEENVADAIPPGAYHDTKESIVEDKRPVLPFRFRHGKAGEDEGDVWRCENDGCMHRVYAASEPASLILIKDHRRTHEYDEDQRVRLVRRMQAPWLPVGRLMGRVRELAAQSNTPPPVVQRY